LLSKTYKATPNAFHDIRHIANAGVVRANFNNSVDATGGYSYRFRSFDFTTGLTIHTVVGYDNVTGIGTINGVELLQVTRSRSSLPIGSGETSTTRAGSEHPALVALRVIRQPVAGKLGQLHRRHDASRRRRSRGSPDGQG
jgi:hypothetical protein